MAKSIEIRESTKTKILGSLAGWLMKAWCSTLRYEVVDLCGVTKPGGAPSPAILVLWHNRIFAITTIWKKAIGHHRPCVVLTSASHDGSVLARAMSVFGLGAVRGSSSRRGVAALIALKRTLKTGTDICITPDGPRGPRYKLQPGIVKLAESTGAPIVPMNVTFSAAWRLKTWDRFVIPKPFSRVKVTYGPLFQIPPRLDESEFAAESLRLEQTLVSGTDDATDN